MSHAFNIYCDESCHLENDGHRAMVLGAIWCPSDKRRELAEAIRAIKIRHGLSGHHELKWTRVSPGKLGLYTDLIDLFFSSPDLRFRALVVPDKGKLDHARHGQTHDTFYYKMYFELLKWVFEASNEYFVYLDIKDTRGGHRVETLHRILCYTAGDHRRDMVRRIQLVRSHEVELLQLADVLIGILSYANRGLTSSTAKTSLVEHLRQKSRCTLTRSTAVANRKFNIFRWTARESA